MSKKLIDEKFTESDRNSSMFFIPRSWVNAKIPITKLNAEQYLETDQSTV